MLYLGAAFLLNSYGFGKIPLSGLGFGGYIVAFWVFVIFSLVYVLGFKHRRQRYVIFSLGDGNA